MDDRSIMENSLNIVKGACELYQHGTTEASTAEVHEAFKCALNECLNIQNKIYNLMAEKGWYPMETVTQSQINTTKQKFANQ